MTGHIPGTTVLRAPTKYPPQSGLGSNQSGLRATNERLILSLIRTHGQLSKAQLAELSGLAMQTASVISRSLIDAGLLVVGELVRGKVGQPYMPLKLNPDGAMFLGVHIGKTKVHTAFVDFVGGIISEETVDAISPDQNGPDLSRIAQLVWDIAGRALGNLDHERRARFQGIGVSFEDAGLSMAGGAMPWNAVDAAFDQVRNTFGLSVHVASNALSACSAEVIYGIGTGVPEFLYVYLDHSVSGGLVQDNRISFSSDALGPNLGKMRVPNAAGVMVPLKSLALLADSALTVEDAIDQLAQGLAHGVTSVASVVRCQTVVVDGSVSADILRAVIVKLRAALAHIDMIEAVEMAIREGSSRRKSMAFGAACLPLAERFYPLDRI